MPLLVSPFSFVYVNLNNISLLACSQVWWPIDRLVGLIERFVGPIDLVDDRIVGLLTEIMVY